MSKPRISYSRLRMFEECGYKYWLHYVDPNRLRPLKGLWSPLGNAVHEAIRENLRAKMAGLSLHNHDLRAGQAFDRLLEEDEYALPEGESPEVAIGQARSMAMKLAELHAREAAPEIYPYLLEQRFEIEHPDYVLTGYIDILEKSSPSPAFPEGMLRVRDTKTSARKPAQDAAERSLQLRFYAGACRQIESVTPSFGVLDVLMKARTPTLESRVVMLDERSLDVVEHHVEALLGALERDLFAPAPPDAWWCSKDYCGYFQQCRYALRPVTIGMSRPD